MPALDEEGGRGVMAAYASDYAVIDFERSLCGDCAKLDTCIMVRKLEECYDPFWEVETTLSKCNRYLSMSTLREDKDGRKSTEAQG